MQSIVAPIQYVSKHGFNGDPCQAQLSFAPGSVIMAKPNQEGAWWWGACQGKEGWFPPSYVAPAAAPAGVPGVGIGGMAPPQQQQSMQQRMQQGLVEEAQLLHQKGMSYERMEELGLEYKFLSAFLQNKIPKEEFFSLLATAIHQYAKRQRTWFRKMEKEGVNIDWLDPLFDLSTKIESIKKLLGFTS